MKRLYAVYDEVAKEYGPITAMPNDESAMRAVSKVKWPPGTKANDFVLRYVGYQEESGALKTDEIKSLATYPAEDVPV